MEQETFTDTVVEEKVVETPKPQAQKITEAPRGALVMIDTGGQYVYKNQVELGQAAQMMIRTREAPDHLAKEGREAVAAALLACRQYGLTQAAMKEMAYVKGRLMFFGSLFVAVAQKHPKYGEKRQFFVDENGEEICFKNKNLKAEAWAAVVQIKKIGEKHWSEYFFTIDDAKRAMLDKPTKRDGSVNEDAPWLKYTRDMLMHKAVQRAMKAEYASALAGVDHYEDLREVTEKDVTPKLTTNSAAELENALLNEASTMSQ